MRKRDREISLDLFVGQAVLGLLCGYYLFKRRFRTRIRSDVRRMRDLRSQFYMNMWRHAAEATGAHLSTLPNGTVEIERVGRKIRVHDNITSLDSPSTLKRAEDKVAVRALLFRFGIPVPHHIVIKLGELDKALQMLRSSRRPLVVKPAERTSGGAGVSTNVTTAPRLRAAIAWAHRYGSRILIEEQIEGDCYRVLVMDGEVLDTVVRHPPRIIGDGASTVRQLISHENTLRLKAGATRAQVLIGIDPDLRNTLASQALNLRARPAKGEVVVLKQVINDNGGRENVPVNGRLCSAIHASARRAAEVVGSRLAGVDIICCDPSVALEESGGAILEVNTVPGFYYHYHRDDSSVPIADRVLNRFFNDSTIESHSVVIAQKVV